MPGVERCNLCRHRVCQLASCPDAAWACGWRYCRGETELQDITLIVDYQVHFEAKEHTGGRFPVCSQPSKHFVGMNAPIETHIQGRGDNESHPVIETQAAGT